MILLRAAEREGCDQRFGRSERTRVHSILASYRGDFGWRFCSPLSLLLMGLLDSPSERMSSIWDSLHVRSPSAGIRDGAPIGLCTVSGFLSFASSDMVAILFLGGCFAPTQAPTIYSGTLSRTIDGIRSTRLQYRDGALQIVHMLLHLRQRTVNFLTRTMPQRMDTVTGPKSYGFS